MTFVLTVDLMMFITMSAVMELDSRLRARIVLFDYKIFKI